jgi:aryl-alcohol dehydrogenase
MTYMTAALTACCGADWKLGKARLAEPRDDEVLVRICATGVCHTDVSVRDQHLPTPLPAVLGHEGAGIVERIGAAVTDLAVGDHVVLTVASCGHCTNCLRGLPTYCESAGPLNFSGRRPDGSATISTEEDGDISGGFFGQSSFATYAIANRRNAVRIPKDVPLELMGPLGCGIQTGAGTVINTLRPRFASSLVVFGAGAVGISAIMAARLVGCATIVAVDVHANRLELAKELGATHTVNVREAGGDVVAQVRQACGGAGADYVVDTTGVAAVAPQAAASLAPLGQCAIVGVYPPGTQLTLPVDSIFFGQTVGGAIEGNSVPKLFIPQLISMWRQGRFPFDRMVAFYDFSDINHAVADALSGKVLKPVLRIAERGTCNAGAEASERTN